MVSRECNDVMKCNFDVSSSCAPVPAWAALLLLESRWPWTGIGVPQFAKTRRGAFTPGLARLGAGVWTGDIDSSWQAIAGNCVPELWRESGRPFVWYVDRTEKKCRMASKSCA